MLLGSPEDFSLVSKDFEELNLDIHCCLDRDEVLQIIKHECEESKQPVIIGFCGSSKDFQTILRGKNVVERSVGVILCNPFENRKLLAEMIVADSPLSDIGEFALELVHKTFEQVEHIQDILRHCEPLIEKKQHYFQPINQKIPAKNKFTNRNIGFPRKILRRWNRFVFWTDFFK